MAQETFANRAELRRRLRARLGASTNDAAQVQTVEQLNEYLREAAQMVRDECEWKRLVVEYFFTTGINQRYYNYPANSGPGDVVRVYRWDGDANGGDYVEVYRRMILPYLDNDPILTGAPETATLGIPQIYEETSQQVGGLPVPTIELNPIPDAAYPMKVEHTQGAQLTDDVTPCIVDADCIVDFAFAEFLDHKGQDARADKQRQKGMHRLRKLSGAQRTGRVIKRGLAETVALKAGVRYRQPLNFDTSLSVMP